MHTISEFNDVRKSRKLSAPLGIETLRILLYAYVAVAVCPGMYARV